MDNQTRIDLSALPYKEVIKGFRARFIHTDKLTLGYWDVEEGAELPSHSHLHEQTTQVLEGKFELTIDGVVRIYEPGTVAVIPPHVLHSGRAVTKCKLFDIFCPVREDYASL